MGFNALIVALLAGLQRARRRAEAAALRSAFLAEASSEGEGQGATFVVLLPLTSVDERASVPRRVEPTGQMRERCSGRRRAS